MSDLRVAIVGIGRAGMVHARNFAVGVPGARLVALVDPNDEARRSAAAELGIDRLFASTAEALAEEEIDGVVIASPTFAHADAAIAALDAGKHVLCEKPMASTLDDAERMTSAAARSGAVFAMGFVRRYDARFRRLAERIAAGDIGTPLFVRSTGRGPGLPPAWAWDVDRSGGLAAEVNSHDIDTIRWLSGQEPVRVYAVGRASKRPDIAAAHPGFVDLLAATIELSQGAIAQLDGACPADYGYDARVEVYGTEGVLLVGGPVVDGALLVRPGGATADAVSSWRTLFADAYREEDRHFVAAALGREQPQAGANDGLQAVRTVDAANRSMRIGQPIELATVVAR